MKAKVVKRGISKHGTVYFDIAITDNDGIVSSYIRVFTNATDISEEDLRRLVKEASKSNGYRQTKKGNSLYKTFFFSLNSGEVIRVRAFRYQQSIK